MVDSSFNRSPWDERDGRDGHDGRSSDWSERPRRAYRRPEPGLEKRLDQWMTAGRQLVDGVAGARPGGRGAAREDGSRLSGRLRPGDLGRWVENRLDWLLEDDDGWREPWQERTPRSTPARPAAGPPPRTDRAEPTDRTPQPPSGRRQPLEAISRRTAPLLTGAASPAQPRPQPQPQAQEEWPDDTSFSVNRWRRGPAADGQPAPLERQQPPTAARAVPRSSRRRRD